MLRRAPWMLDAMQANGSCRSPDAVQRVTSLLRMQRRAPRTSRTPASCATRVDRRILENRNTRQLCEFGYESTLESGIARFGGRRSLFAVMPVRSADARVCIVTDCKPCLREMSLL